jgi:hypothetical protein
MVSKAELLHLQDKARRCNRIANFTITENNEIDGIFYSTKQGVKLLPLLSFAEMEREKPYWYQMPESFVKGHNLGNNRFKA